MKKLSKLSLLGEMDFLSKAELKKLVGSSRGSCSAFTTESTCHGPCSIPGPSGYDGECICVGKGEGHTPHCSCGGFVVGPKDYKY